MNNLYKNEYVEVYDEDNLVYITVLKEGYSIGAFNNDVLANFPRIKIEEFTAIKTAINNLFNKTIKVGKLRPIINIEIDKDMITAYAIINLTEEDFSGYDKNQLKLAIIEESTNKGVIYGVDEVEILTNMKPLTKFIIAKGKEPIKGNDAIIHKYEIKKIEPELSQDGSANFYELNLINTVKKGDWLGERIEPTSGIPGLSVLGREMAPEPGIQIKLQYDKNTVSAVYDEKKGTTTLYAKRDGAAVFIGEAISVSNYIDIDGNVGVVTGNIDFDGYVDIQNTVEDNFSVKADGDIQVLGEMGIGAVDLIESREGNIYIRGGVAGHNKAKLVCKGNLYTKFAADCTIECDGTVNIGYYAMNCIIKAKEVILESSDSKIIGGSVEALTKVVVAKLGSRSTPLTKVTILGFDKEKVKTDYDIINLSIEKIKQDTDKLRCDLDNLGRGEIKSEVKEEYDKLYEKYIESKKRLNKLYDTRKLYVSYLHTKGEGEVRILKEIFPNVMIKIKNERKVNKEKIELPISFYLENSEIRSD